MVTETKINLRKLWAYSALIIALMFAFSFWAWPQVPADALVPTHWNAAGQADGFGPKWVGLLLLPLVCVGVVALFSLIRYVDPKRANIERSATAFQATLFGVLIFMLALHGAAILNIVGYTFNLSYVAAPAVGLMFIIMGNYMGKIRRNYMFGVRTPWTLASELSWNKTHRLAGKLFVIAGVLILLTTLWEPAFAFYTMTGAIFVTLALTMGYSYWVWKHDPAIHNGGTAG